MVLNLWAADPTTDTVKDTGWGQRQRLYKQYDPERCLNCGEKGHLAMDCPKAKADPCKSQRHARSQFSSDWLNNDSSAFEDGETPAHTTQLCKKQVLYTDALLAMLNQKIWELEHSLTQTQMCHANAFLENGHYCVDSK